PPIWRRIEVPGDTSLRELSDIVQRAMGWEGYHLYSFHIGGVEYGEADEDGWLDFEDAGVAVSRVARGAGARLEYLYDFGDEWTHDLVVEAVAEPEADASYPRCVAGARACPPEDCGGVGGYYRLLEALRSPHAGGAPDVEDFDDLDMGWEEQEAEELRAWAGGFEPERFDVDEVNGRIDDLTAGPVLEPECAARFQELAAMVLEVASGEDLSPSLIVEAIEVLGDYAAEDPAGFMAGRKPEILAAAALHSAGMLLPWGGRRPRAEELAALFGVSVASVAGRSRTMRDIVSRPHLLERLMDDAVDWRDGLPAVGPGPEEFQAVLDAVGFEPPPGDFDPGVLAGITGLGEDDLRSLVRALERGLELERTRRGRTDLDPRPLVAQLGDSTAFGSALREALGADDGTPAARDALARWVVGRLPFARPPTGASVPCSCLLAVDHLAGQGVLHGDALADATILAIGAAADPEAGLKATDVRALLRALGTDEALDPDERADLLYSLLERTSWGRDGRTGPELVTLIAEDQAIPVEVRSEVMSLVSGLSTSMPVSLSMTPSPAVRRCALVHLGCLEDEPESFVDSLLDARTDPEVRGIAAAELLAKLGPGLSEASLREWVRRGLAADRAPVRQAFFRTGLALLGDDVRAWAPEELTGTPRRSGGEEGTEPGDDGQMRLL
ncbi:MAG: hypothetical protein WD995_03930, partial [Gemmatimonadota bacterium]